jgi:hypothetical protein
MITHRITYPGVAAFVIAAVLITVFTIGTSPVQAATVREEVNGAFNVANPSQPVPANTSDAGWIYTATQTYMLGRIEFKFANSNGVAIGIDVYDNAPALGGVLLATGAFTPVGGNVWEGADLSAQIPVTAGQTLFIGVRDFYSSPTTDAGGAAAYPLYFSTTPSNYGTNGTAFNNFYKPIMRLIETQATFAIDDVTVAEGDAGTVNAVFTVTRAGDTNTAVSVDFATANVSATGGVDYVVNAGTVNFGIGVLTQNITIVVNGDAAFEGNETFNVNLNNPSAGAIITDNQGVGTITDDDAAPGLSVNSVTVSEAAGAGGFTVTLNPAAGVNATVDYTIADGTAANGVDYNAVLNGTLTFIAGDTAETIPFTLIDNALLDGNRTFTVTLSNSSGPVITVGTGTATIADDESPASPPVVVSPVVVSFPPPPPVPLCADLNGATNTAVRASIPPGVFGVHCRMIAEDGVFIRSAAEVGVQSVVDQGVGQAVDVFSPSNADAAGSLICLRGTGSIIFLAANAAPRTPQALPVSTQNGYTCATIPGTGIVALVAGSVPPAAAAVTTSPNSIPLTDCRVTTTHQVRLREQPNTESAVLTTLPYDVTYTATARAGGWIQVIEGSRQGWVSATYLNTSDTCG